MIRLATVLLCLWAGSAQVRAREIACDPNNENLQTYLRMSQVLFNDFEADRIGEFYAEEFISHDSDEGGSGPTIRNHDDLRTVFERNRSAGADRRFINNVVICNQDIVVAQITVEGRAQLDGMPEERPYRVNAIEIYRFQDGKIVERWGNSDQIGFIRQLGVDFDISYRPLIEEKEGEGASDN